MASLASAWTTSSTGSPSSSDTTSASKASRDEQEICAFLDTTSDNATPSDAWVCVENAVAHVSIPAGAPHAAAGHVSLTGTTAAQENALDGNERAYIPSEKTYAQPLHALQPDPQPVLQAQDTGAGDGRSTASGGVHDSNLNPTYYQPLGQGHPLPPFSPKDYVFDLWHDFDGVSLLSPMSLSAIDSFDPFTTSCASPTGAVTAAAAAAAAAAAVNGCPPILYTGVGEASAGGLSRKSGHSGSGSSGSSMDEEEEEEEEEINEDELNEDQEEMECGQSLNSGPRQYSVKKEDNYLGQTRLTLVMDRGDSQSRGKRRRMTSGRMRDAQHQKSFLPTARGDGGEREGGMESGLNPAKGMKRGKYRCKECGLFKRGHECLYPKARRSKSKKAMAAAAARERQHQQQLLRLEQQHEQEQEEHHQRLRLSSGAKLGVSGVMAA